MIGSIEHAMQESHRGVRGRLGMPISRQPSIVRKKPAPVEAFAPQDDGEPADVETSWTLPAVAVAVCQPWESEPISEESNFVINMRWRDIVKQVCEKHRVSPMEIRSRHRNKSIVAARHEAFYRLRTETALSYPQIGKKMGGFDHTTCYNGVKKHEQRINAGTAI